MKENFKIMTVLYIFTTIILHATQAVMHLYVYLEQHIATELLPFDNKNAEYRAVHLKHNSNIECNIPYHRMRNPSYIAQTLFEKTHISYGYKKYYIIGKAIWYQKISNMMNHYFSSIILRIHNTNKCTMNQYR